MLHVLRYPRYW